MSLSIEEKQFRVAAVKIAKAQQISMTMNTKKLVEFNEENKQKVILFSNSIKALSPGTKVIELIRSNQNMDVRGYDIKRDKALYLQDDEYYKHLVGEVKIEQATMF